ncbi:MAG: YbhB/YbcL family Raf kinase inhibitor-like protein [Firmicutes bacterium]|nr:YbhB/YbcL family Raf kinase inhibitor-like protein [Bacillota bacterium]
MKVTSSAFKNNGAIPERHARQGAGGENVSIPLEWQGAPEGTKSFAFTMVDISARNWVHWLVVDIPAKTTSIAEGASNKRMPDGSKELINTFGDIGYGGPQPPPGSGPHKYVITVYALSEEGLDLPQQISYDDFLRALEGKVLAKASIIGKYSR